LSGLITDTIGDAWVGDAEQLAQLEPHIGDAGFLDRFQAAKRANKDALSDWFGREMGVKVDPTAMFDIQIKRIHEYKRQHLNILETIALWQEMRDHAQSEWTPRVVIFGGKAAPGYHFAKHIIYLINSVARVLNNDPVTSKWLKVVYPANYNVTLAERLIPAADLSEQISTAGKEASGTGNMKFAMNGALTIGTLDGANVEIREHVGADNFFLFGMTAQEVMARRQVEGHAGQAIAADPRLARALDSLRNGTFADGDHDRFRGIADNIAGPDYFLVASDFSDYWRASREADVAFRDPGRWMRMAALNTARSGWFSSDRTIRSYASQIWDALPPRPLRSIAAE
jgi:starch phosphorylase